MHRRATKVLLTLLGIAVAVSVVHYVDNYVNYDDYPVPDPGSAIPVPSATVIAVAWFVFTASGALGVWLWFRRRITAAAVALTGYSVSGLIGFGHYTAPGAFDMVWWRQTHVVVDILCGLAVLGFALWAASNRSTLET
ncbi:MAG TPA: hypothetical protein VD859_02865 [Nocardioides sp.]|nr:hypothetical protein [Nocardioides sp.]